MKIGSVDLEKRVFVVAEIGNNHEGSRSLALELVMAAAEAGVDAVKVQIINPSALVHPSQAERIAQLKKFQLPLETFRDMAALAVSKGIQFLASAFDEKSLDAVSDVVSAVKVASGDLDYVQLLKKISQLDKPIILSTGMSTLDEVQTAVDVVQSHLSSDRSLVDVLALLHCVSLYPTPLEEVNLAAVLTLQKRFGLVVGYSDHTLGVESAVAALSLGSRIIEKHFTLDKTRNTFRDHALSADSDDMRRLTTFAHSFDKVFGHGEKCPSTAEEEVKRSSRRSIVASRNLAKGTILSESDFVYVRPQRGLSPSAAPILLGRKLRVALKEYENILESHVL